MHNARVDIGTRARDTRARHAALACLELLCNLCVVVLGIGA